MKVLHVDVMSLSKDAFCIRKWHELKQKANLSKQKQNLMRMEEVTRKPDVKNIVLPVNLERWHVIQKSI